MSRDPNVKKAEVHANRSERRRGGGGGFGGGPIRPPGEKPKDFKGTIVKLLDYMKKYRVALVFVCLFLWLWSFY